MDPDYTLRDVERLSREILDAEYPMEDPKGMANLGLELAEMVDVLNTWLSEGGFPPRKWLEAVRGHRIEYNDDRQDSPDRKRMDMVTLARQIIADMDEPESMGSNFLIKANKLACQVLWMDNQMMSGKGVPRFWDNRVMK